jgi:hypothetical protein
MTQMLNPDLAHSVVSTSDNHCSGKGVKGLNGKISSLYSLTPP